MPACVCVWGGGYVCLGLQISPVEKLSSASLPHYSADPPSISSSPPSPPPSSPVDEAGGQRGANPPEAPGREPLSTRNTEGFERRGPSRAIPRSGGITQPRTARRCRVEGGGQDPNQQPSCHGAIVLLLRIIFELILPSAVPNTTAFLR